jgi:hypothetical protein
VGVRVLLLLLLVVLLPMLEALLLLLLLRLLLRAPKPAAGPLARLLPAPVVCRRRRFLVSLP